MSYPERGKCLTEINKNPLSREMLNKEGELVMARRPFSEHKTL